MDILQAIILGAVEGFTEYLPISSTGHLILVANLLGLKQTEFVKSFEISIQLGAILSVVALYSRTLFLNTEAIKRILVALIPTAIIGLSLYSLIKTYLIGNEVVTLFALGIGGVALIIFEFWYKESEETISGVENISYKKAFWIGVCQSLAIIPGVSRSAATIVGGLLANIRRDTIVEFSFLLAVPTMAAATGLDLLKSSHSFSTSEFGILFAGFITSFVVALFSVKFLINFVKRHTFMPFGIYRILLALLFWLLVLRP